MPKEPVTSLPSSHHYYYSHKTSHHDGGLGFHVRGHRRRRTQCGLGVFYKSHPAEFKTRHLFVDSVGLCSHFELRPGPRLFGHTLRVFQSGPWVFHRRDVCGGVRLHAFDHVDCRSAHAGHDSQDWKKTRQKLERPFPTTPSDPDPNNNVLFHLCHLFHHHRQHASVVFFPQKCF